MTLWFQSKIYSYVWCFRKENKKMDFLSCLRWKKNMHKWIITSHRFLSRYFFGNFCTVNVWCLFACLLSMVQTRSQAIWVGHRLHAEISDDVFAHVCHDVKHNNKMNKKNKPTTWKAYYIYFKWNWNISNDLIYLINLKVYTKEQKKQLLYQTKKTYHETKKQFYIYWV